MRGAAVGYLSLIVLIPLAAVAVKSTTGGLDGFWHAISSPAAKSALILTFVLSLIVVLVSALFGTLLAWVLVRDEFPGKHVVNTLIDLPFALPTIVAGLTLIELYGPRSPVGLNLAYTRAGVLIALLFVTLPFVVRAVQPVLIELDTEMEEAATSLGARPREVFWRIIVPNLRPAILAGAGLAFARALGEYGSVVLISGNIPLKTQVGAVLVFGQIQVDQPGAAAAVSVVLLGGALIVLAVMHKLARRLEHSGDD